MATHRGGEKRAAFLDSRARARRRRAEHGRRGVRVEQEGQQGLGRRQLGPQLLILLVSLLEAAAALANMENEFGRTTDPVRMYMREMGTVDLLTREGEIKIAKRIEEGSHQVLASLSSYPRTVLTLLEAYDLILKEEVKLSDIVF